MQQPVLCTHYIHKIRFESNDVHNYSLEENTVSTSYHCEGEIHCNCCVLMHACSRGYVSQRSPKVWILSLLVWCMLADVSSYWQGESFLPVKAQHHGLIIHLHICHLYSTRTCLLESLSMQGTHLGGCADIISCSLLITVQSNILAFTSKSNGFTFKISPTHNSAQPRHPSIVQPLVRDFSF